MQKKLLKLLVENARIGVDELATRLKITPEAAAEAVRELERSGVVCGYTAILADKVLSDKVRALIEVKITPRRDGGFDQAAKRIAKFPEVLDVFLVSGSYDLLLTVEGESLKEVAAFVSAKLSTIDGVISTATSFQLKKYKESGRIMDNDENYERLKVCP